VATTCASARAWARWTLELLASALVRSTEQEHLSRETVRQRHIERHGVTPRAAQGPRQHLAGPGILSGVALLSQLAEREGFEPSIRLPVYTRSRRAPSTTRPPLLLQSLEGPRSSPWRGCGRV
jgi:hypothetical protein